ncbi:hypothetical protein BMW26_00960 [Microbacterium sp. 1.5R]|nr:hypothetical protein BMW26_00960 [Microbacterium sp. 1.5R]
MALIDAVGTLIRAHHAHPGEAHLAFARVGFTNVLTTNFDFLLEKAYDQILKSCLPIIDETQLSAPNRTSGPRVIKFHGDLHHPSRMVLTEDDYDRFLSEHPLLATSISAMMVDHTGVLIGYSLDDPDTRQLLTLLKLRLGSMKRPLWTIQFDAQPHTVARFERRGVKVVNLKLAPGHTRSEAFALLFDELAEYWKSKLFEISVSSDDRVAADLRLPGDDARRLCYFAIPPRLVGWYRDNVFPEAEAFGLVPVVQREVFSAPGTAPTKVDALVERSLIVIAELDADYESYEASFALATKGARNVLLVRDDRELKGRMERARSLSVRPSLSEATLLYRPSLDGDPAGFVDEIRRWLTDVVPAAESHRDEPARLLASRHFGPALISAVSLLEVALGRAFVGKGEDPARPNLRNLVKHARRAGLIESDEELHRIEQAITKRNEAVHRVAIVTSQQARAGIEAIMPVVQRADRW